MRAHVRNAAGRISHVPARPVMCSSGCPSCTPRKENLHANDSRNRCRVHRLPALVTRCLVAQAAFRQSTFRKLLLEIKNLASSCGEMASTAWIALNGACLGLLIGSPLRGNFVSVLMDLSALKSTKPLPPLLAEWGCDEELWSKIKQKRSLEKLMEEKREEQGKKRIASLRELIANAPSPAPAPVLKKVGAQPRKPAAKIDKKGPYVLYGELPSGFDAATATQLLFARQEAKIAKQYAAADAIRGKLTEMGVTVRDDLHTWYVRGADGKILGATARQPKPANKDIVDTAVAAGVFGTLAVAVGAAGLVDTLKSAGPFTVFAPTDAAFAKLPAGTVEELIKPENKAKLAGILTYHVVSGKVMASTVVTMDGQKVKTVNGQEVSIKVGADGVMVDGAKVVTTDIECSNGVIHIIDSVILPA